MPLSQLTIHRFGLSFLGSKWSEETLIGFAYAYEQRTHIRSKAKTYIVPNIQLSDVVVARQ
jgi:amidase